MICEVKRFNKVERENALPYFIVKAQGIEGDANASVLDENGCINPLAVKSRIFNFTKTLFPSTENQCLELEKAFQTDDGGNVTKGAKIRLMSAVWATPYPFYIRKSDSVTGVYETESEVTETKTVNGRTVELTKVKYTPKVFNNVNLTLFENSDGTCAEGDPDVLCKAAFERGLINGVYVPCEEATDVHEVVQ